MEAIIIKYLEGTASEKEVGDLLEWIRTSEENRNYFTDRRKIWIASGNRPSPVETDQAFLYFKEKASRHEIESRPPTGWIYPLKIAASITILLAVGLGAYLLGVNSPAEKHQPLASINQVVVRNEKSSLSLPDGTLVWLKDGSVLTYPQAFSPEARVVKLEGEGYFEVAPDRKHPFFVETGELVVKVLGTVFNVSAYSDNDLTETVLLSGKVEVKGLEMETPVVLLPDQKFSFDKRNRDYNVQTVDASLYAIWKNERLVMENEELGTILQKLEHWYGIRFLCEENVPLTYKYSMTITDEPKEEILYLLSVTTPIRYKIDKKTISISRK